MKDIGTISLVVGGQSPKNKDQVFGLITEMDIGVFPFVYEIVKAYIEFSSQTTFHYDKDYVWIFVMFIIQKNNNEITLNTQLYKAMRDEVILYPFSRDKVLQQKYQTYNLWKTSHTIHRDYGIMNDNVHEAIQFLENQQRLYFTHKMIDVNEWTGFFEKFKKTSEKCERVFSAKRKRTPEPISEAKCIRELMALKKYRNLLLSDDDEKEELALEVAKQSDAKNNRLFEIASFTYLSKTDKLKRETDSQIINIFNPISTFVFNNIDSR